MDELQYVIVLKQPIRIGRVIFESIGPFKSVDACWDWFNEMNAGSVMPLPDCNVITIIKPETDPR